MPSRDLTAGGQALHIKGLVATSSHRIPHLTPKDVPMTDAPALLLSENAAKRIANLAAQESKLVMFRIAVSGGGCSGFQYGFSFDDTKNEDDQLFEQNGVRVVIDTTSLAYLAGSQVDFVEDLVGAAFAITNPNASSSCSCGNSFAVG